LGKFQNYEFNFVDTLRLFNSQIQKSEIQIAPKSKTFWALT
jgi:hypothetical protein